MSRMGQKLQVGTGKISFQELTAPLSWQSVDKLTAFMKTGQESFRSADNI